MLIPLGFSSGAPDRAEWRGSHVAIRHPDSYRICQALIHPDSSTNRVIPDFREPDIIRIGITPLYTTFTELFQTVIRIQEIVIYNEHLRYSYEKKVVT